MHSILGNHREPGRGCDEASAGARTAGNTSLSHRRGGICQISQRIFQGRNGSYNLFQRNDGKGIRVGGELLYGYDGLRVRVFDHPRGLFTEVRRFDNAVLFQGLGSFGQSS